MKILAIDSSAVSCSVALSENENVISSEFVNNGLTHSQTLMPMVKSVLAKGNVDIADIDLFAVTNGPGSFTGVRIGVSAIKGLAFYQDKPCIGISTLELIAANIENEDSIVISCMDARRNQIYTATFESCCLKRLTDDEAVSIESLEERINSYSKKVYLSGDGAFLTYSVLKDKCPNLFLAEENALYQNAEKLCALAFKQKERAQSSQALVPAYLRLSQAERELKKKKENI